MSRLTNTCVICYANDLNLIVTKCGHSYCSPCFLTWYFTKLELTQDCCYCRQKINLEEHISESFSDIKEYSILKQLVISKSYFKLHELELPFIVKGLIPACYYNDLDVVANILENDILDMDGIPDILLYFACMSGKKEVLYYFIDYKSAYFGITFIKKLLYLGHIDIVEFIYKSTSKVVDIYEVVSHFIKKNEVKIITKILKNELFCNILTIDEDLIDLCVMHSNLKLLKEFERIHPCLINGDVIYVACAYNNLEVLQYILNKKDIEYSIHDSYLLSIESKCYDVLEYLLKNRKSDYEIFLANKLCDKYDEDVVKKFISHLQL